MRLCKYSLTFLLKWGNKMKKILILVYTLKLKNIILFLTGGLIFTFLKWSYSQRCFDVAQSCQHLRWKWQRFFDVDLTFATSWRHINLKTTLKWRWNICWVRYRERYWKSQLFTVTHGMDSINYLLSKKRQGYGK